MLTPGAHTITTRDGHPLSVRVLGRGEPCVLLHGFGMESRHWLPFAWALRKRYQFVMPDLRGFGASHDIPIDHDCALSRYADDVHDALEQLFPDRAVPLGGISMGAFTALTFRDRYGFSGRVSRYLHIDQAPRILNRHDWEHGIFGDAQGDQLNALRDLLTHARTFPRDTPYESLPRDFRRKIWRAFGDFTANAMGSPLSAAFARRALSLEWIGTSVLPTSNWYAYIDVLGSYLEQDYDVRDGLSRIQIPVTVMVGMRSRMYPPEGQMDVVRRIPHARLVRFPRAGHSLILEQPARFVRELDRFLQG